MNLPIKQPVDEALQALSIQQREVLVLRYGLSGNAPHTLQKVASHYSLTRERIRQIQMAALKALREKNECIAVLSSALSRVEEAVTLCGGGADQSMLCHTCELSEKGEQGYIALLLDVGSSFQVSPETGSVKKYWFVNPEGKQALDDTLTMVHERFGVSDGKPVEDSVMRDFFAKQEAELGRKLRYDRVLQLSKVIKANPYNEWGHRKHPQVSLSNLSGYIYLVLRKRGEPLHFGDIAEEVAKLRGAHYHLGGCHNELVRNKDFVLVGRGLYGLREHGFQPGTIRDVIVQGLTENGSMTRDEIIAYVCDRRKVKDQSILLTLCQKSFFVRTEEGKYQLVSSA